ncbi:predicted nucleoside phosphorylase [Alteracholeplasma palmae J233]|uniref:Uridine phosphorylase n=1 Tax=Alteracholeplasma palmae (strain ATCC 49389 / J233) TaxID=1318466 RepID=U4KK05_ALTPJ|nr:nucleoside phosphorylase [Alteracholeplasma palmae]CCV63919.1 predicted nucleoside phosphorylase [Alteracholeplasma palmae J233]
MSIEQTYRDSEEVLKISDIVEKYHRTYDTVIMTFQSKVLPGLLEENKIEVIEDLTFGNAHGKHHAYKVIGHDNMIFYLCPIGAPMAVGILEEIVYKLGIKNIVMYGSSGVLDKTITEGKIIVPTKAYRDEGTSYHYMPKSDFVDLRNYMKVSSILKESNIDYVEGYIWTTDAFYRETKEIFQERRNQGCIAVDMEVSAVEAFSRLRNVNLYNFVYGADNLDSEKWDKRILGNLSLSSRVNYFLIALLIAKKISR